MLDDEQQVVHAVSRFYRSIFDSATSYFEEEHSNCVKLLSTSDGQIELARMVVLRVLAEASYQAYTNDTADLSHDGSSVSEDTLRLVVARQDEVIGQLDELLDMIYPVICDVSESGLLPQYARQKLPENYDF